MEEKRKDASTPPPANTPVAPAEAPVSEPPPSRRRGGGLKRKASALGSGNTSTPPTTSSKRQTREMSPPIPFLPIHNGPLTRARQQPNIAAAATSSPSSVSAVAVKEVTVAPQPDAAAVKAKEAKEAWEALEAKIEAEYEAIKSRDANAHVVPTHAGWFSWTNVHPLEEKMLPSFFNGKSESRTREIYKEIRNWIMKKYHTDPKTQFELKDLSELSVGDMEARQEVMEFLDYWGLINFHPFPQTDSAPMSVDADADADADADKDATANSLIESLFRFETEEFCTPIVPSSNLATPALPSGLFPDSAITEELVKSEGQGVEYHCNSCSGDCSRKRYHCQKQADFDLCSECFNNGKFGSDMSPSDFILMEPAEAGGASGGKWTDQETLLLLEALELYKENWNEIAEHVATKTKSQCILHFIEMPIEDTFLDSDDRPEDTPNKENVDALSLNNDTCAPKDVPETTESKEGTNENQPSSSPMEISKPEDLNESNYTPEINENFALKSLREAFEAVECLPLPGEQLSFADAGNPVMTLASFLVRLVEPNMTTAAVHSSIKSISGHSTGEQLAARHCFRLEDPPEDKKEAADTDRITTETTEQGGQKDEDQNNNTQKEEKPESITDGQSNAKQKEEKPKPVTEGPNLSNDQSNAKDKDRVTEKDVLMLSSIDECADKSDSVKDSDGVTNDQEAEPSNMIELEYQDLARAQVSGTTEEPNVLTSKVEVPCSEKDLGDIPTMGEPAQSAEALEDEDMISGSAKEEPEQLNTSNPVAEDGEKKGREEAKDEKNEKKDPSEANNDISIDKIKRAAVTALSAAAVKAKFLAREEEDQIRQLATLLVEKQLYKLEAKLAFFNDMENAVMRVREQLERSKQRLYHERAQIIATRLGMSASSSRPQSMPVANRVAMAFANSAPRPPISGTVPRPPTSRSMMGSPPSGSYRSAPVAGSSMQPADQEKLSSVTSR